MNLVCIVMVLHWLADFVFQSRWMAENKSKQWFALLAHIAEYGIVFLLGVPIGLTCEFIGANMILHAATDAVTSRASSWCYRNKKMRAFWAVIGADQTIHGLCFVWTWRLLDG